MSRPARHLATAPSQLPTAEARLQWGFASALALLATLAADHAHAVSKTQLRELIGLDRLESRLLAEGQPVPTGRGVVVGHVEPEVVLGGPLDYAFDPDLDLFNNVTQVATAGPGEPSSHANLVGGFIYGQDGVAPGASDVYAREMSHWVSDTLGTGSYFAPRSVPESVQNHSWAGSFDFETHDRQTLDRVDLVAHEQKVVTVVGVSANSPTAPVSRLLGSAYNTIAVGSSFGSHSGGLTEYLGSGRTKPDLVAPGNGVSASTAIVSGAAALLKEAAYEIRRRTPKVPMYLSYERPEVIKAAMLTGASKDEFADWSRSPEHPLDPRWGAGELDVDHAHRILTAGRFSPTHITAGTLGADVPLTGWDYVNMKPTSGYSYLFEIPASHAARTFSATANWHRIVEPIYSHDGAFIIDWTDSLADVNLRLLELDAFDNLVGVVQESVSAVDNVEHLFIRDLPAGRYALRIESDRWQRTALSWDAVLIDTPVSLPVPGTAASLGLGGWLIAGVQPRRRLGRVPCRSRLRAARR